jgi:hypothetical protein
MRIFIIFSLHKICIQNISAGKYLEESPLASELIQLGGLYQNRAQSESVWSENRVGAFVITRTSQAPRGPTCYRDLVNIRCPY